MRKIERDSVGFKREYIPVVIAVLILGLLITALVYTIIYKPEKKEPVQEEYSTNTEELSVNTDNLVCGDNDFLSKAKNVKVSYEADLNYPYGTADELDTDLNGDGVIGEVEIYAQVLRVTFTGLPDDMYLVVTNDLDDKERIFTKSDIKDGKIEFVEEETMDIRTYDVKVISDVETCQGSVFREFTFKLPRSNEFYKTVFCMQNESLDICAPFIYEDDLDVMTEKYNAAQKDVIEKNKKEQTKQQEETKETFMDTVKKNYVWIIVGAVVVIAIVVGALVIRRRMK